ncbi:MAG: exodeoxyribonuclease VII small subunit [Lachnospiraceae bacterium]|nr:exodeoxyribonuclease VII small subunit [Lachnospiraceae bacterium]MBO4668402.1 exodeoxyribonuclease VII small subunit [Lachnospiraceae bacterium]MBR5667822.1 exodeoxyribonuclease VII small subunit [Lachnospiraceae bacterium]
MDGNKEITLEERMQQTEEILRKMETMELTLQESFKLYREGMEQLQKCSEMIDSVEKQLQIIEEGGNTDE